MAITAVNGDLAGGAINATGHLTLGGSAASVAGNSVAAHAP